MKTQILLFLISLATPFLVVSQSPNPPIEIGNVPVSSTSPGGAFSSLYSNLLNKRTSNYHSIIGTPYLYEDWSEGKLVVLGEEAAFDEVKVNVLENVLEVKVKKSEKILEAKYLTSFDLIGINMEVQHFLNGNHVKYEGKPLTGFLKETKVGQFTILTRYKARWVKPDQNAKIVGIDPRDKIVHSKEFYILKNEKIHFIKNKNGLLELLRRKEKKIKSFMKENKTNVKEEQDLVAVLAHYNG